MVRRRSWVQLPPLACQFPALSRTVLGSGSGPAVHPTWCRVSAHSEVGFKKCEFSWGCFILMQKRTAIILAFLVFIIGGLFLYSFYGADTDSPFNPPGLGGDDNSQERVDPEVAREIIEKIELKMDDFSPVASSEEGNWKVKRVAFVSPESFYVTYSDIDKLRRVLLEKLEEQSPEDYRMTGYFEPGENFWELEQGEDPYFGESTDIYEKNEDGEWERIN